jgi:FkbM family methyltransferase
MDKCNGQFEAVFGFEPSRANFDNLLDDLKSLEDSRIELFNIGLAKEERTAYFPRQIDPGAFESSASSGELEACTLKPLTSVLTPEKISKISFITLDVEGAEMEILQSIEDIIKSNKPKLAISIYHKPEDVFKIPLFIHSIVPEYKLYIRHHTNWFWETVLYAVL